MQNLPTQYFKLPHEFIKAPSTRIPIFLNSQFFSFRIHLPSTRIRRIWEWIRIFLDLLSRVGGAVALWLVRSTPDRAVQVQALAGDIVLCSWARHFTLTVPLSTHVYKWVPVNCWGNLTNWGGVARDGLASCPGEVEIVLAASWIRDKLRQLRAWLGSKASLLQSGKKKKKSATNPITCGRRIRIFSIPMT